MVRTSGDQLDFGPLTLLGNSTIDTSNNGGSVAGAALNLAAITGGGFSLGLDSGTSGAITVSGAADDISTLTITQSNGTMFLSTLGAITPGAVTITDSEDGQTVAFQGNTSITTLSTANAGYNVSFTGALTTFSIDASFLNTGAVTLGDAATDVILFGGGVNTTGAGSNPSATNVFGVVRTSGDQLDFGPLTLLGNSTIDTTNSGGSVAGAALNLGAITGGGFSLGLNSGTGGAITVSGAADDISTLTITQSNGTTFLSTLGAITPGAVTITDSEDGQTVAFQGNTSITTLTTSNAGYNVSFTGALTTISTDTGFLNTGTVTLGDAATDVILFDGGLNTIGAGSNPSATNVFGMVRTSGDQLDFGPLTLLGNSTIDTTNSGGSVAGAALNLEAITGGGFSLGLNSGTGSAIIVSGVADGISTLTITQSNGTTFQSTLGVTTPGAVTIADSEDGQTVSFLDNTSITTLTTANAGYIVSFTGALTTLANDTSFLNTGTVTLGDAATDVILFAGGVNTTGAGSNPSATNVFGMVRTSGGQLDFGPVALVGSSTMDTTNSGGSAAGAALNVETITGGGFSLGLNSGTGSAIMVSGAADDISTLTITQSNGATFQSTLGGTTPGAVTIADSEDGQTVAFQGDTSITTLTTANAGYNVSFTGALTTLTNDTSFLNTGTVTLGDAATDVILFDGGVNTTGAGSNPSATNVFGMVRTSGDQLDFGPLTLLGNSAIDATNNGGSANGANISFHGTLDGDGLGSGDDLTLEAGTGNIELENAVGGINALGNLTINSADNVRVESTVAAASLVQVAGTGTTTLRDDIATTAPAGVDLTSSTVVLDGLNIMAGGTGIARFNAPTELTTAASDIDTGGTITFENTLTSPGAGSAQNLTLESDANIDFNNAVGAGVDNALGAIQIDTAVNVEADSTVGAASCADRRHGDHDPS